MKQVFTSRGRSLIRLEGKEGVWCAYGVEYRCTETTAQILGINIQDMRVLRLEAELFS